MIIPRDRISTTMDHPTTRPMETVVICLSGDKNKHLSESL
jgi:hypothetical protein